MAVVPDRWLSKRALSLHVAMLVVVSGCTVAALWQVNRAQDGNTLSYFYSIMWPVFGLLGIYFWWLLLHTDYESVGLKGMRRSQALAGAVAPDAVSASSAPTTTVPEAPVVMSDDEDPELAAYNARLAELSSKGPKTWRNREAVVVRRAE